MLRLDSIKILAPFEAIKDYSIDSFSHTQKSRGGTQTSDILTIDNIDFGISRIAIDNKANNMTFEVSAKALKNDYASGINIDTFEQLISNINKTKVIYLDASVIYNKGQLLKADVTDNVRFDYEGKNVYQDLACIPLPNKYEITQYGTNNNQGLVFAGKQKSFKERIILYNKLIELRSNKKGKDFLNSIDKDKIYNDFKNSIRVETNFTQLRKIREYIGSNNLIDVLSSDAKVNYKVFQKITKQANTEVLYLFDRYEGMKLRDIINRVGIEGIIKDADYNWQYLDMFLRKKVKSNYRRERTKFKKIFTEMQSKQNNLQNTTIVELFLDALSKVA